MPRWLIHHSPNTFTTEEKQTISQGITKIYAKAGLPDFYVHLHFQEMSTNDTFIGGKSGTKFVDLTIYHLARVMETDAHKQRFMGAVDAVLAPILESKGAEWEYFVTESPRDLWKINGMVPPEAGSEEEKRWRELNRPVKL